MKQWSSQIILIALTLGFGIHSAVAQFETNLPPAVRSNITKQVQAYFPNKNLKGIPLLDPKIDWNKLENWPDEFSVDGKRFVLELLARGSDTMGPVISRKEARSNFIATYKDPKAKESWQCAIKPFGSWNDGRKWESSVSVDTDSVFGFQNYPTGELYSHYYDKNPGTKVDQHRMEYYSKTGKLVGFLIYGQGPESRYEWRGKSITADESSKETAALFHKGM